MDLDVQLDNSGHPLIVNMQEVHLHSSYLYKVRQVIRSKGLLLKLKFQNPTKYVSGQ